MHVWTAWFCFWDCCCVWVWGGPKEEFNSLADWTIETHKETRDALHKKVKEKSKNKLGIKPTQAKLILKISDKVCTELFHDQYQTPYAAVTSGDHLESLPLGSKRFKNYICGAYYDAYDFVPNPESITSAISILKYKRISRVPWYHYTCELQVTMVPKRTRSDCLYSFKSEMCYAAR